MDLPFSSLVVKDLIKTHRVKLVLFGETHGFLDDAAAQSALFDMMVPEFLLHEMVEEKSFLTADSLHRALSHGPDDRYSMISTYGELRSIFALSLKYGLPLVGIDFKDMGRKDTHIFEIDDLNPEEEAAEEELQAIREHKHANVINEYVARTSSFVVASMGAYHLREDSLMLADLHCDTYIMIFPSINGDLIMGPEENMTPEMISYSVRLVHNLSPSMYPID